MPVLPLLRSAGLQGGWGGVLLCTLTPRAQCSMWACHRAPQGRDQETPSVAWGDWVRTVERSRAQVSAAALLRRGSPAPPQEGVADGGASRQRMLGSEGQESQARFLFHMLPPGKRANL